MLFLYAFLIVAVIVALAMLLRKSLAQVTVLEAKLALITSIEEEAEKLRALVTIEEAKLSDVRIAQRQPLTDLEAHLSNARAQLGQEKAALKTVRADIAWLDASEYGRLINLPDDDFEDAGAYSAGLRDLRAKQKAMAKAGNAAVCGMVMIFGDSKVEGAKMTKRTLDLMLRAFNGECDAVITKAKAGKENALGQRIEGAAKRVNRLGEKQLCELTAPYVHLKLQELHLYCAYQLAVEEEKEEQREIREQMREEARVLKELEKMRRDAEAAEKAFHQELREARRELEKTAAGKEREALEDKLRLLQGQLDSAHASAERAMSQAQLTRMGHVYIISNVGSFGEGVLKVGMTRRLVPQERVDELGDASVPFRFDVHAMIKSDDAPSLEKLLHKALDQYRVNKVNTRKEFFRVSLDEIRALVESNHGEFRLTRAAEATEFRRSQETA